MRMISRKGKGRKSGSECSIHTLPNELLTQIFGFGTQDWAASSVATSILPFPLLICGVCKHWREVTLKFPDVWSTIYLPICSSIIDKPHAWIQPWIDRAKSVPLTIILDISVLSLSINKLLPTALLSAMIKNRIRRLDIRSRVNENDIHIGQWMALLQASNRNVYEQISLCFPNHRRGRVRFTKDENLIREEWGYGPSAYLNKFTVAKLRVRGLCVYSPQFRNLTSLTAWEVEATFLEFQDLLAESPSLTTLVLCRLHVSSRSPFPEISRPISVPSLRRLAVSFLHSYRSEKYPIRYLHLPNLNYLEINKNSSVSLSDTFENSLSSADQLHTLKLFNFPPKILNRQPGVGRNIVAQENLDDIFFLRSLTSVHHLHLIDSAAALLSSSPDAAPRRLRRSYLVQSASRIDERAPGSKPSSIPFPNLQTITLATLAADDLVDLCDYVGAQMGQLEVVYLSTAAQHHLSHTLVRKPGEDAFAVSPPRTRPKKKDDVGANQAKDAEDWLRKRVEVHKFDPASRNGLLEDTTDQDPLLGEMV